MDGLSEFEQHPFTTAQARDAGLREWDLRNIYQAGFVRRLIKGVFVASDVPDSLALRCSALRLVVPPRAVVTDGTAFWLHTGEFLEPNADLEPPPVAVFHRNRGGRLRNGLVESGQRMMPDSDVVAIQGLLVTTPVRTALDLARLQHRDRALAALDAMLRSGLPTELLLFRAGQLKHLRGVRQMRALVPIADGRSQSPGESALRLRWLDCPGLPPPEPQIAVPSRAGSTYWLDLGNRAVRFAAEYDGAAWHSDADKEHDAERRRWIEELGWTIRVFRREDVFGQQQRAGEILLDGVREARVRSRRRLASVPDLGLTP